MVSEFKRGVLFAVFAVFLLFLAGCSSSTNGGVRTSGSDSGFFGKGSSGSGTEGVVLTFAPNNPGNEMYSGVPQKFAFIFTNYQRHEVSDLLLKAKGFDFSYVTGLESFMSGGSVSALPPATLQAGPGVYDGLRVDVSVNEIGDRSFNFNPTFEYCYTAKTSFSKEVCVPSVENVCRSSASGNVEQNGPLKVVVEKIFSVGNQVRVNFQIQNAGSGVPVTECFNTNGYVSAPYNNLVVKLGQKLGDCKAVGDFKVVNGRSNFFCTFERGSDDSYASQVIVNFDYKYQQSLQLPIVVKNLDVN